MFRGLTFYIDAAGCCGPTPTGGKDVAAAAGLRIARLVLLHGGSLLTNPSLAQSPSSPSSFLSSGAQREVAPSRIIVVGDARSPLVVGGLAPRLQQVANNLPAAEGRVELIFVRDMYIFSSLAAGRALALDGFVICKRSSPSPARASKDAAPRRLIGTGNRASHAHAAPPAPAPAPAPATAPDAASCGVDVGGAEQFDSDGDAAAVAQLEGEVVALREELARVRGGLSRSLTPQYQARLVATLASLEQLVDEAASQQPQASPRSPRTLHAGLQAAASAANTPTAFESPFSSSPTPSRPATTAAAHSPAWERHRGALRGHQTRLRSAATTTTTRITAATAAVSGKRQGQQGQGLHAALAGHAAGPRRPELSVCDAGDIHTLLTAMQFARNHHSLHN